MNYTIVVKGPNGNLKVGACMEYACYVDGLAAHSEQFITVQACVSGRCSQTKEPIHLWTRPMGESKH